MPDPFHPDLRRAQRMPRAALKPRSLRWVRLAVRLMPQGKPRPDVVRVDDDVTVRVTRPRTADTGAALLWIHGGGMVIGAAKQDDALARKLADALGITVAAVEYRLAPEHPFPTPFEDCYAALVWLAQQPGVAQVAVGGASAGGGLAAGVALAARDRGEVDLAAQLLVYPMIDDRSGFRTDLDESRFRLWNTAANRFGWSSYLGWATDISPYAAPARATELAGLPPTWIGVGTNDLFHDEDVAYAERLEAAGVVVEREIVIGGYHGFDATEATTPVAQAFHASAIAFLGAAWERAR